MNWDEINYEYQRYGFARGVQEYHRQVLNAPPSVLEERLTRLFDQTRKERDQLKEELAQAKAHNDDISKLLVEAQPPNPIADWETSLHNVDDLQEIGRLKKELAQAKEKLRVIEACDGDIKRAERAEARCYELGGENARLRAKLDKLQRAANALVASVPWRSDQFVVVPTGNVQALKDAL